MYISQNRLMWVLNEIQGRERPLGGTNIDFSELLMQSFCIEERGTYKNNSGTGLKRRVELCTALSKIKQVFGMFLFLRFPYIFLFFWHLFILSFRAIIPVIRTFSLTSCKGYPFFGMISFWDQKVRRLA